MNLISADVIFAVRLTRSKYKVPEKSLVLSWGVVFWTYYYTRVDPVFMYNNNFPSFGYVSLLRTSWTEVSETFIVIAEAFHWARAWKNLVLESFYGTLTGQLVRFKVPRSWLSQLLVPLSSFLLILMPVLPAVNAIMNMGRVSRGVSIKASCLSPITDTHNTIPPSVETSAASLEVRPIFLFYSFPPTKLSTDGHRLRGTAFPLRFTAPIAMGSNVTLLPSFKPVIDVSKSDNS